VTDICGRRQSLSNVAKLNTASHHINNTTQYNVNHESIMQSVRCLIGNALQADLTVTQSQQQSAQPPTQQTQQAKRKSRSPSHSSSSDPNIADNDQNNTAMDMENSISQTPNTTNNNTVSCIQVTKVSSNSKDVVNKSHNSSRHPHKLTRQSTSTLLNKTISQANKETARNNNV
jgi:hypothetical protein